MGDPRINEAIAAGRVPPEITVAELEESQDTLAVGCIIAVTVLASAVVTCRFLSRKYIVKQFGLGVDDRIALASLVTFIPLAVLCIVLINMGAGRNFAFTNFVVDDVTYQHIQTIDSVAHLIYCTSLLLCRISGLALYYRICSLQKGFLLSIRAIFVVLILGYVAQICLIVFHCRPVTLQWAPATEEDVYKYKCMYWYEVYVAISSISLASDFLLFGLPAAMLKMLHVQRKQKILLACVLLPGIIVIGISAGRIVLVMFYGFETPEDFKFSYLRLLCVEVSEVGATLITLSIPAIKPMVDKCFTRKDSSSKLGEAKNWSKNVRSMNSIHEWGHEEK